MRRFSPRWRKALLVTHVVTSVGWLGGDAVLLVLGVAGLAGLEEPDVVYPAARLICLGLVAPLAVAAWLTGVIGSVGTRWGLLRHWWVVAKLATTTVMTCLVLFLLTPNVITLAQLATTGVVSDRDRTSLIVAPTVASALLILNTVLSVYKPWGRLARSTATARRGSPELERG